MLNELAQWQKSIAKNSSKLRGNFIFSICVRNQRLIKSTGGLISKFESHDSIYYVVLKQYLRKYFYMGNKGWISMYDTNCRCFNFINVFTCCFWAMFPIVNRNFKPVSCLHRRDIIGLVILFYFLNVESETQMAGKPGPGFNAKQAFQTIESWPRKPSCFEYSSGECGQIL